METNAIQTYMNTQAKAAPLAVFRILFGLLMFISMIRFWYNDWIEKLYLAPSFHFHYSGFEFVQVPGIWTYGLFVICGLSALFVSIGYQYRIAIISFFMSFTYIELMDKTTYLNHYYFISVVSLILIFLPAHSYFSVDAFRQKTIRAQYIPRWNIDIIKLLLAIVYIYAGFAKLNHDWLINAMPLTIWLPSKTDVPIIGSLMSKKCLHYLFSWGGALYDLFIVFFLMCRKTRFWAFIAVLIFHILTRILFPIGMFPYIMIVGTLMFFDDGFHDKILHFIARTLSIDSSIFDNNKWNEQTNKNSIYPAILGGFMFIQLLFPLRYLLNDGNIFWTEQGYRFSWRVMLMEKTGYANFKIVDGQSGKRFYIQNEDFLTPFQQKQMATQPDFILEYGQYLGRHFAAQGHQNVEVYVENYVSLNARPSQVFISPDVDLLTTNYQTLIKNHVTPIYE